MPRAKIQMNLIGNARDRAKAFERRKAGLLKKARELAELCDVDVAVVCAAGPGGGAPPVVWESDPGAVIDRYRRLPADKRAKHTHLGYVDGQLSKEEGRLDKKRRQGLRALACPDEAALEGMDLEELLASIDAALLATAERRKALGVADDDHGGQQLGQVSSDDDVGQGRPPFVGGSGDEPDDIQAWVDELMWDGVKPLPLDAIMPSSSGVIQHINGAGGNDEDMGSDNHQCQAAQMPPGNGENGHGQFPWHAYQPPNTTVSFPDYSFQQCTGNNNYVDDMDEYSEMMLMPSNANAAAYGGWYDQASWGTNQLSCDAIAGNPAYTMPPQLEHHGMGIGSFVMDAGGHEHETTGCLADHFQCPDGSQHFGAEPEPLHYLSDMAQDISYYDYDDLEAAGGCSSGRAQLFAPSHSCSGTPPFGGSEQSQSGMGHHQYQDTGVQHFWVVEGPPGSTDVAAARARGGGTWANSGGLYQPWIPVYQ